MYIFISGIKDLIGSNAGLKSDFFDNYGRSLKITEGVFLDMTAPKRRG